MPSCSISISRSCFKTSRFRRRCCWIGLPSNVLSGCSCASNAALYQKTTPFSSNRAIGNETLCIADSPIFSIPSQMVRIQWRLAWEYNTICTSSAALSASSPASKSGCTHAGMFGGAHPHSTICPNKPTSSRIAVPIHRKNLPDFMLTTLFAFDSVPTEPTADCQKPTKFP